MKTLVDAAEKTVELLFSVIPAATAPERGLHRLDLGELDLGSPSEVSFIDIFTFINRMT